MDFLKYLPVAFWFKAWIITAALLAMLTVVVPIAFIAITGLLLVSFIQSFGDFFKIIFRKKGLKSQ